MHKLPLLLFIRMWTIFSMHEASRVRDGEKADYNLKLCLWSLRTYQWKSTWFIPFASLQSIHGRVSWLLSISPFKSGLPCREGGQPLHPLSHCKDKLKESLEAKCVLCAPQPGSLRDKLGVHSMHLSYVHATFVATVVGYQDTFLRGWRTAT